MIILRGRFSLLSDKQRSVSKLEKKTKPIILLSAFKAWLGFVEWFSGGYSFTGFLKALSAYYVRYVKLVLEIVRLVSLCDALPLYCVDSL
ncbi:hypothetical protein VCRA2113O116_10396 [Vibrio crassostreae]|nr:hypothetical protein VCRA2113O116_10396 [Vibrio crassostreae]